MAAAPGERAESNATHTVIRPQLLHLFDCTQRRSRWKVRTATFWRRYIPKGSLPSSSRPPTARRLRASKPIPQANTASLKHPVRAGTL